MEKVLLVIGDAAEVTDTLYPYYRIAEDGYEVLVGAPEKRTYHLVQHDSHPDWDITVESKGYEFVADIAFREVNPATYVDEPVVVDGNIVTARTFHDNAPWMREYMKLLNAARDGR